MYITLHNRWRFEIHGVPKWWRYNDLGSIRRRRYCFGIFYQVRNRHVKFRNVGPYGAAPQVEVIHRNQESFDPLFLKDTISQISISDFFIMRAAYTNLAGARSFIYVYKREYIWSLQIEKSNLTSGAERIICVSHLSISHTENVESSPAFSRDPELAQQNFCNWIYHGDARRNLVLMDTLKCVCDTVLEPMWRYSHCRHYVAVTTGGVSLRLCTARGSMETKNYIFLQINSHCSARDWEW